MKLPFLLACVVWAFLASVRGAESFPTLALGSAAPDFNLPGVDGRTWALKDFSEAKLLVVVFTCNHCPTAQYYEDRLKKLVTNYRGRGVAEFDEFVTIHRMYRHRDFEMVLVSMDRPEDEPAVLEFLKKQQASNRNLIFASADRDALINAFNPKWPGPVPYSVLISPEGRIVYEELGTIDPLALKRAIVKAMNERKPWPER